MALYKLDLNLGVNGPHERNMLKDTLYYFPLRRTNYDFEDHNYAFSKGEHIL